MNIQLRFQYVYFVSTKTIKQNYQTLYFELAHNKFSYVFYFKLNHHTLLFRILCLKINTITIKQINMVKHNFLKLSIHILNIYYVSLSKANK